jgi:transcriptional regulator with XRE-family HTH domain
LAKKAVSPALVDRLKEAVRGCGLSLNELGKRAGLDHARLSRFVRGERDLTLTAAAQLFEALGFKLAADENHSPAAGLERPAEPTAEKPRGRQRKKR